MLFQIRRSYLVLGILSTVAIAVIGGVSVFAAALNIDRSFRYPVPMAYGFGCFWGAWFVLALYSTAFAWRDRLTVTADWINHKGVFRTVTIPVAAITAVEWIRNPNRVVVRYPHGRIKIELDCYVPDARGQLVQLLRSLKPAELQSGWSAFEVSHLRNCQPAPRSRGAALVCLLLYAALSAGAGYGWLWQLGLPFLLVSAGAGLAAVWYLVRIFRFQPHLPPAAGPAQTVQPVAAREQ
ncbi:MAG: hypothetical protein ACKO3T_04695 [Planctomycetaceae bacterium]